MEDIKTGNVTIKTHVPPGSGGFLSYSAAGATPGTAENMSITLDPPKTVHKIKIEKQPDGSLVVYLLGAGE